MPASSPSAIFLSYARDDAAAARRIAEALRGAGLEVWFDENELTGGDAWDQKIRTQIAECTLFVPIISTNTQARLEGYFRLEWRLAEQRSYLMARGRRFLVPVCVDDTREKAAQVPDAFLEVQWTRLKDGQPNPAFVESVKRLAAPAAARSPSADRQEQPASDLARATNPAPSWKSGPAVIWALTAVAVLATASVVLLRNPGPPKGGARATFAEKSIAVLPFVNLGPDKADEYLGDGMTEELLNVLAKIRDLRVPGRTSCFAFKGRTDEDIFRQVGEKLRVATVLEGSVRRTGHRLRITAQLIKVDDGYHLWSETYDRDATDILAVQTDVAQRVVQALQTHLGITAPVGPRRTTSNPAAFEFYLKGRFNHFQFEDASTKKAIEQFNQALTLDPNYAQAHAGLAAVYAWISSVFMPPNEAMPIAKRHALRALELDDSLGEVHHSLACVRWWSDWDFPGAEAEFRLALASRIEGAETRANFASFLSSLGRFDEALALADEAIRIDPTMRFARADVLLDMHRYEEADAEVQRITADSGFAYYVQRQAARMAFLRGRVDEAVRVAERCRGMWGDRGLVYYALILAKAGRHAQARSLLAEIDQLAARAYVSPVERAALHEALGERDRAFVLLEEAYAGRSDHLLRLTVDWKWDGVRDDPRFVDLLRRIGFPPFPPRR